MAALVFIALLLGTAGYSSATYCVCKDGVGDTYLQKNIDFACGFGADCSSINQHGACYEPNTVKSHCDYAVNSYYQKKGQVSGSCDFRGTATVTLTLPNTVESGCTYPASPSQVTSSTVPTTTDSTTTYDLGPTSSGIDSTESYGASTRHGNSLPLAGIVLVFQVLMILWG